MATSTEKPTSTDTGLTSLERVHLPRISIKFCTQCRWMLRAAYVCWYPQPYMPDIRINTVIPITHPSLIWSLFCLDIQSMNLWLDNPLWTGLNTSMDISWIEKGSNILQFAQELLSTFNTDLGEVALVPMTGGVFTVTIWHAESTNTSGEVSTKEIILWDRKRDGGFPGKSFLNCFYALITCIHGYYTFPSIFVILSI